MIRCLDFDGNAADHQNHLVGSRGDVLVDPSLQVGEFALYLVDGYTTHANLVCHEYQASLLPAQLIEFRPQPLKRGFHVALIVEEEIRAPKSHAIDYGNPSG